MMKRRPVTVDLDPKAVTCDELFGVIHPATREWKDGETLTRVRVGPGTSRPAAAAAAWANTFVKYQTINTLCCGGGVGRSFLGAFYPTVRGEERVSGKRQSCASLSKPALSGKSCQGQTAVSLWGRPVFYSHA